MNNHQLAAQLLFRNALNPLPQHNATLPMSEMMALLDAADNAVKVIEQSVGSDASFRLRGAVSRARQRISLGW